MKKKIGFTLIELLVVVGIVGLVLPAIFAIIFAVIRQQARVFALKQVKREGDFVLNAMEFNIRNYATGIFADPALTDEYCDQALTPSRETYTDGSGDNFYFEDDLGNWFRYYLITNNSVPAVASGSGTTSDINLTTSKVRITNFSLTCEREAAFSAPVISISFDVTYNSPFQDELITLPYKTQVQMKNY